MEHVREEPLAWDVVRKAELDPADLVDAPTHIV
jgi:hypothetical protein